MDNMAPAIFIILLFLFDKGRILDGALNNATQSTEVPSLMTNVSKMVNSTLNPKTNITTKELDWNNTTVEQSTTQLTTTLTGFPTTTTKKPSTKPPVVKLPNEQCMLRRTLVNIDEISYKFVPLVVSLARCGGACGILSPSLKRCKPNSVEKVPALVFNKNLFRHEVINVINHTSCGCHCVYDASVCDAKTQVFNTDKCRCECKRDAKEHPCPPNYIWDNAECQCICIASCNYRQDYNATDCSCNCRKKFFRRCNRKNKVINEETCKCMSPAGRYTHIIPCDEMSRKWVALVAVLSCITVLFIVVTVLVLTRSSDLWHPFTAYCSKSRRRKGRVPVPVE